MVDTRFPVSVHLMTALAIQQPNLVNSEALAQSIKTNASFVRKLVVALSAAGLVESVRGKLGGVRLARSPSEITLDKIYSAVVEGNAVAVPTKAPYKECKVSCSMGDILKRIACEMESNTMQFLAGKSLADVLKMVKE